MQEQRVCPVCLFSFHEGGVACPDPAIACSTKADRTAAITAINALVDVGEQWPATYYPHRSLMASMVATGVGAVYDDYEHVPLATAAISIPSLPRGDDVTILSASAARAPILAVLAMRQNIKKRVIRWLPSKLIILLAEDSRDPLAPPPTPNTVSLLKVATFKLTGRPNCVALFPDGKNVAVAMFEEPHLRIRVASVDAHPKSFSTGDGAVLMDVSGPAIHGISTDSTTAPEYKNTLIYVEVHNMCVGFGNVLYALIATRIHQQKKEEGNWVYSRSWTTTHLHVWNSETGELMSDPYGIRIQGADKHTAMAADPESRTLYLTVDGKVIRATFNASWEPYGSPVPLPQRQEKVDSLQLLPGVRDDLFTVGYDATFGVLPISRLSPEVAVAMSTLYKPQKDAAGSERVFRSNIPPPLRRSTHVITTLNRRYVVAFMDARATLSPSKFVTISSAAPRDVGRS